MSGVQCARSGRRQGCCHARLVLGSDAVNVEHFSKLVEAAVQVVAELHQVLDVVHGGEVNLRSTVTYLLAATCVNAYTRRLAMLCEAVVVSNVFTLSLL